MKKLILFCCLSLNSLIWSQEINVEVIYTFGTDNKKITKSDEFKIFKGIEFKLVCNTTKSRFELIEKMDSDVVRSNKRFVSLAEAKGIFFKDLITKENLIKKSFVKKEFIITYPYDERYQWKLTKETKTIGGYVCYKAIHTDSVEFDGLKITGETIVYYTPEIPSPFGPINIHGLPGLVLEAQSRDYYYIAKSIVVSKNKKVEIKRPTRGEEVTFSEYVKQMQKISHYDIEGQKKMMAERLKILKKKLKNEEKKKN